MSYIFTSESVSEGHPDKLCDRISDSILDEALRQDPESRVAAECFATTGLVVVGGEITTKAWLDVQKIVRDAIRNVGYTNPDFGLDADSCSVLSSIHEQSPDIAQGVNVGEGVDKEMGAGDQGIMFGYACKQTDAYMPLPIHLSHKLLNNLARMRKNNELSYLRPDSKAQVTVKYEGRKPVGIHTILISTQHNPDVSQEQIYKDLREGVIAESIPAELLTDDVRILVNPTGRFVIGGPHGDTGLTGRKIIVDTYGGWASHGGGAFSGKDPSKVDRSAAYMARYVAKNIVASGIADEIEIQLAYAIGVSKPLSVYVDTKGSSKLEDNEIIKIIDTVFDLRPEGIISTLDLKRPIYKDTSAYGHFGRTDIDLSWEKCDKVEAIQALAPKEAIVH
jgi:S-adenosylmethionine synthetase